MAADRHTLARIAALEAAVFGGDTDDAPEVSEDMKRDELDAIARDEIDGYDPDDHRTKADVVAAIRDARA